MPVDRQVPGFVTWGRYDNLFSALLARPGEWCSLPLVEIAGESPARKQISILNNASLRGIKIKTTVQEGRLYARLRE